MVLLQGILLLPMSLRDLLHKRNLLLRLLQMSYLIWGSPGIRLPLLCRREAKGRASKRRRESSPRRRALESKLRLEAKRWSLRSKLLWEIRIKLLLRWILLWRVLLITPATILPPLSFRHQVRVVESCGGRRREVGTLDEGLGQSHN